METENKKKFPKHIVTVAGMITNDNDQVLMMKHPKRGWELPGGQVEVGEDLITALEREIFEETGVKAKIGRITGIYSNIEVQEGYNGFETIPTILNCNFTGQYIEGDLRTSDESLEVSWIDRDEVLELVTTEFILERIKDMLEFDGTVKYRAYTRNPYIIHVERDI